MTAPARVVELIGPAGSGKSTLARTIELAMERRAQRPSQSLGLWGQPRARLLRSAIGLLPLALRTIVEGRPLRPSEFAHMVRIDALTSRLHAERRSASVLIDEGAVFGLTWLRVTYGAQRGGARAAWYARTIATWARSLSVIVQLDAADEELARRIRTRAKAHQVKDAPDEEIQRFSADFRRCFADVMGELRDAAHIPIVRLRTDVDPPEHLVACVSRALERAPDAR